MSKPEISNIIIESASKCVTKDSWFYLNTVQLSISSFSLRPWRPWRFVKKFNFDKEF